MKHWMFDCKEVTRLVSQSMDMDLPLNKRMGLRIHLMMCKICALYKKQLLLLRDTIKRRLEHEVQGEVSQTLPTEARDRIQRTMTAQISKTD